MVPGSVNVLKVLPADATFLLIKPQVSTAEAKEAEVHPVGKLTLNSAAVTVPVTRVPFTSKVSPTRLQYVFTLDAVPSPLVAAV